MIRSGLFLKLMSSAVLFTAAIGVSSCASANSLADPVDAVLLNPQDAPTRQAIRVFVRESSGPELIAMPDSLATNPKLVYHKREGRRTFERRRSFKTYGDYRLIMNGGRCWLTHTDKDLTTHLELPSSANCAVYTAG